jgi:hypothetical protein
MPGALYHEENAMRTRIAGLRAALEMLRGQRGRTTSANGCAALDREIARVARELDRLLGKSRGRPT